MRIKRLELHGFKSFKDKTVIHFDSGITGIVGPNGCGKSNVVDAFFWALGEMNPRNLRGQNMDDLIFNGSDHSQPSNSAEVNLILEVPADLSGPNAPGGASFSDLSLAPLTREVAITRRLYRNGDSEYLINKVPCRLRDIQELFMDTGAGARGYSIIQQGKIAEIVNAKPEERRTMIEDVAGVVKYKSRRREAQRKLESTTQNLLRVSDILTEIEQRRRQMERQAEKARRYKEWKAELQTLELRHSASQWEEIVEKLGAWDKELADLEVRDAALTAERETADTYAQQKRLEATSAGKVCEEMQNKWFSESQDLSTSENNLSYQKKVKEDLERSLQEIDRESLAEKARIEDLLTIHQRFESETNSLELAVKASIQSRLQAEDLAHECKERLDALEQNLRKKHESYLFTTTECSKAEQKLIATKARLADLEQKILEIQAAKACETARLETLHSDHNRQKESSSAVTDEAQKIAGQLSETVKNILEARQTLEQNRKNTAELERAELRLQTQIHSLEDQQQRQEGCSIGVQNIFQKLLPQNSDWQKAILGTIANALKVAPGLEIAVETALGPYLENVLAKDNSTIAAIIASLKDSCAGRANFVDLSQIPHTQNHSTLPAGVAEPISAFVQINGEREEEDQILKLLLGHLLTDIYLVPELATALELAKNYPGLVFVTREGDLVRDAWRIAGGDTSQVSGTLVTRNRELEEYRRELSMQTAKVAAAKSLLSAQETALCDYEIERSRLETEREESQNRQNILSADLATIAAQIQQAQNIHDSWERDLSKSAEEITSLQSALLGAQADVERLGKDSADLNTECQALREKIPAERAQAESAQQSLLELRVREASLIEQKNSAQTQLRNAKTNLEHAQSRVESLLKQSIEKKSAAESALGEIAHLGERIQRLRASIVGREKDVRESRATLDAINHEIEEYRQRSEQTLKSERAIKDSISHVRLQMERVQLERQNLAQNTLDRYGIEIGEFVSNPEIKDQLHILKAKGENAQKDLESEVMRLKEKIRKLGEVNTAAIEEFEELSQRFTFLAEQKADLEKSMGDLQNTIEKINRISKERFFRAYNEVNRQFTKVFPALFGGGQAELTLTNPDDFNETGVDIVAQPPGKKLQNINLLSGGEKTLTAISLLFAIFLVKPSPFCLLDEVDAPLDDANIGRFNALLREMSAQSQFIIITHNKRTMELNDKLYGVTMEDAGISKMVSIQMTG